MCATGAVDIWLMYVTIKMMIKRLHFHLVQSSCRFIPFNYYLGHIYKWRRFWWWTRVSHFVRILSKVPIMKVIRLIAEHYNWMPPFFFFNKKIEHLLTRVSIICFRNTKLEYSGTGSSVFIGLFFKHIFRSDFRAPILISLLCWFGVTPMEYFRSKICFVNIRLIKYVLVWR